MKRIVLAPRTAQQALLVGIVAAMTVGSAPFATAQEPLYHVSYPVIGCADPDAARTMNNLTDPRLRDAIWVASMMGAGKCVHVTTASRWALLSLQGDVALMAYRGSAAPPGSFFMLIGELYDDHGQHPGTADQVPATSTTGPINLAPPQLVPSPSPQASPDQEQPARADPLAASNAPQEETSSFALGLKDRTDWEDWSSGLDGDYREGAFYWAAERSVRGAVACSRASVGRTAAWKAGCMDAASRLQPSDLRRKSDPVYRAGWNSWTPPSTQQPEPAPVAQAAPAESQPPTDSAQAPAPSQIQTTEPPPLTVAAQPDPVRSGSTDFGGGFILVLLTAVTIAAVWITIKIQEGKTLERRRSAMMGHIAAELEKNSLKLAIERSKLVVPDVYGTYDLSRWQKEMQRYYATRLLPILQQHGVSSLLGVDDFLDRIDRTARSTPLPEVVVDDYQSSPFQFDRRMDPVHYEQFCAALLRKAGWVTRLTAVTGDQGVDVIAERSGRVLVVQCKLYSQPVGNDAVQQAFAAMHHQRANTAAVVSNAGYTRSARQLAQTNNVHLLHHADLPSFTGEPSEAANYG